MGHSEHFGMAHVILGKEYAERLEVHTGGYTELILPLRGLTKILKK